MRHEGYNQNPMGASSIESRELLQKMHNPAQPGAVLISHLPIVIHSVSYTALKHEKRREKKGDGEEDEGHLDRKS